MKRQLATRTVLGLAVASLVLLGGAVTAQAGDGWGRNPGWSGGSGHQPGWGGGRGNTYTGRDITSHWDHSRMRDGMPYRSHPPVFYVPTYPSRPCTYYRPTYSGWGTTSSYPRTYRTSSGVSITITIGN